MPTSGREPYRAGGGRHRTQGIDPWRWTRTRSGAFVPFGLQWEEPGPGEAKTWSVHPPKQSPRRDASRPPEPPRPEASVMPALSLRAVQARRRIRRSWR